MTGLFKRDTRPSHPPSWKAYQEKLRRQHFPSRRTQRKSGGHWAVAGLLILVLAGTWWVITAGINNEKVIGCPIQIRHQPFRTRG